MSAKTKTRDGFIDALRAVALIRVVVWHAIGDPKISWIITTMPLMFFVAGSLLASSLDRAQPLVVLRRRLTRLLVPFWFFGALVLSVCAAVDVRSGSDATSLSLGQLWAWIVPLVNPTASAWEAGWASSPLWYLRAYLWILLLSPALLWVWRRVSGVALTGAIATMGLAHIVSTAQSSGPGAAIWILGDLGIYGFFVMLGFAHRDGHFDRMEVREIGEWLCIALAVTVLAWRFTSSPDGVVNHSYPTLLAYGCAWLCAALLVRPFLSRAPQVPVVGPALYWMTRRAMSIYLWHSPAIVASYWLLSKAGIEATPAPILALTAVLVVLASTATGWIEDIAGRRDPELVPLPNRTAPRIQVKASRGSLVAGLGIGITMALLAASSLARPQTAAASAPSVEIDSSERSTSLALPPPPSGRPDPRAATEAIAAPTAPAAPADDELDAIVDSWRVANDVAGVRLGIRSSDDQLMLISGANSDGSSLEIDDTVPVTSITKTMTAAIALQLAESGLLSLDAPLPVVNAAPELAGIDGITTRGLLNHSAGLVPYQQAADYRPDVALTPERAVAMSAAMPLEWEPGSTGGYSNSGFLAIGLLVEQLTGNSFSDELEQRILEPLDLTSTYLDETPSQGWVGDSAGGVVSTVPDLLTWADALYRGDTVLSSPARDAMTTVDGHLMSGLGAFPVCPCTNLADGTVTFESIGHNGGSVTMQYAPNDDIVIVATFTESFWTDQLTQAQVYELLATVRATLAA